MDRKNDGLRLMDGDGYKKIIIACDSYKGCLSSREVNEAIASGVKEWNGMRMMFLPKLLPWK